MSTYREQREAAILESMQAQIECNQARADLFRTLDALLQEIRPVWKAVVAEHLAQQSKKAGQ